MNQDPRPAVELYARSLAPRASGDRIRSIVDRLGGLEAGDTIASYSVHVTGKAIPATPADTVTDYGTFLSNRVAVFQEWASRTGHSIDRQFEHCCVHSAFTRTDYEAVIWPELVLAEYVDGDLRFVAPCKHEGDPVTIEDRLATLERPEPVEESERLQHARADPPGEFSPARQ